MSFSKCLKRAAIGSALVLTVALAPLPSLAHSLADAMVQAFNNSKLLEQQRFLLRTTDEDVAIAQSAFRPTVNFFARATQNGQAGASDTFTTALGLQLQWTLYDGGVRQSRRAAAKEVVLAGRHNLILQEQAVLLNAVTAYLQLRQDQQAVRLRESNLRLIRTELRAAEDRFEVGEVTRTDVAIARARLAGARSALAAAQGQVEVSKEGYRLAIGADPHGLETPPSAPKLPATEAAAKSIALRTHPSISAQQHTVAAAQLQAAAADQGRIGTLSLSGELSTSTQDDVRGETSRFGLNFEQPLYTGGRLSAVARQALANLHASRAELAQQGLIVSENVGRAWALMRVAQAQVAANQQQVRAAQLAFDGVREEASLGARTTLEVLNAEQELLDARNSVLTAQTDAYLAVYRVLSAMGLLTTEHLGLKVEQVDVTQYYNAVSNAPAVSSEYGTRLDRILKRKAGGN